MGANSQIVKVRGPIEIVVGESVDVNGNGVHKIFFENGLLYSSAECRDFKKHGSYSRWSSQEILTCTANYDLDRLHGEYFTRWSDGTPKEVGQYFYDKKIGIYRWYRMDGSLWAEIDCGNPAMELK